ncbi:GtrA family protein [Dinghuibacter silviterrae]|uniref:Putative flippase GtrA n=1 Tax=Dinghuibacter silviterrae TaxID=1539049 RepID=A0A4R8DW17_9BACT|nr:GtrA family protein [Dinghuibacter silviterrae]TDX01675.1 putative flippase GtrA [Dinghuibacter silviterrae]
MAAIAASLVDFLVFGLLVHTGWMKVGPATATGMVCGGILAFVMGRTWVFDARQGAALGQGIRYGLVWIGNIVLSTLLVKALAVHVHYMVARVGVSVVMGLTYSYFMQRWFVFPHGATKR